MRSSLSMLIALLAVPALAAQPKKRPEDHVQGKQIWEKSCWQCHGEANDGEGPAAEMLVDTVPDLRGQITPKRYDQFVTLVMGGSPTHPAFSTEMDDHQAKRIMIYLERMERERKNPPPPKKDAQLKDKKDEKSDKDQDEAPDEE